MNNENNINNVYFTDDKGNTTTDAIAILNCPIVDTYRTKVLESTDYGTNADGIRNLDPSDLSAFIDEIGLTYADDIVTDLESLKAFADTKDPLCDLISWVIEVETNLDTITAQAECNSIDIGDGFDDIIEVGNYTDDIVGLAEFNAEPLSYIDGIDFETVELADGSIESRAICNDNNNENN